MGIFDFLKRHRNKIILVGGAAGAVMVVNKILANYEKQWQTSSSRGFVHEAKKKEIHFENIIDECNQLCQRMTSKIINRLEELMDDNQIIEDLQSKRQEKTTQEKVEIWKTLRLRILTKLLSEVYCTSILVCYMRVQMSVIGGLVYAKSIMANNTSPAAASAADLSHMKAYTKYNAILGSFYEQRFDRLIQPLEEVVEESLRDYNVDFKISINDFKAILEKIKSSFSFFLNSPSSKTRVFFLEADRLSNIDLSTICSDSGKLNENDENLLRNMLDETQDILESDDFKQVLESSIDVGYAVLLDTLLGAFIKMENKLNKEENFGFSNPNAIQVPLVKILPQIRNNYLKRNEADRKALVNHLLCLDVLNCFAANVYEAFCVPK